MSMIRCTNCAALIDSDDDPDCFIPPDKIDKRGHVWCETCRDREEQYWNRVDEGRQRAKDGER